MLFQRITWLVEESKADKIQYEKGDFNEMKGASAPRPLRYMKKTRGINRKFISPPPKVLLLAPKCPSLSCSIVTNGQQSQKHRKFNSFFHILQGFT